MSAFYDQASLVVVPSGYKSGKIYAQKPLTTDGQLTFTRASTATRVNASGLIEEVASGVPRLDYLNSSCPRLLLEPQRTNSCTNYNFFASTDWIKSNATITSNNATSPEGYSNASLLTISAATGNIYDVVGGTGTYTFSVFIKYVDMRYVRLRSTGSYVYFDIQNGTVESAINGTGKIESYGNGWYRCSVTGSNTNSLVQIYPSTTEGGTPTGTGSVLIYGAQFEDGSYSTSIIPTYGTSATRTVEQAIKTIGTSYFPSTGFSAFLELDVTGDTITNFADIYQLGGGSTQFRLETRTNGLIYIQQGNMVTSGYNFNAWGLCPTTAKKLCFTFSPTQVKAYVDGVLEATFDGVYNFSPIDTINFGMQTSSVACKQALLFGSVLSDADCITLTA